MKTQLHEKGVKLSPGRKAKSHCSYRTKRKPNSPLVRRMKDKQ